MDTKDTQQTIKILISMSIKNIVKDILTLQGYDIEKLEEEIFAEELEDDTISNIRLRITERQQRKHTRSVVINN